MRFFFSRPKQSLLDRVTFLILEARQSSRRGERMFLFRGHESHPRSFLKAVSWRTLGSIDTFVLGLIFTSSIKTAGSIAMTEVFTKILLYYGHERAWASIRWGSAAKTEDKTTEAPVILGNAVENRA